VEKMSQNYKYNVFLTNQYRTSPTIIGQMLPKALPNAKSLVTPRAGTMDLGI
jgi:hypothetical protein